jgi:hypothetical protein
VTTSPTDFDLLRDREKAAIIRNDAAEIERTFGYALAVCPDKSQRCVHDAAWAHPCDRDEHGEYECERLNGA